MRTYSGRSTAQRRLIAEEVPAMPHAFTAEELVLAVRRHGSSVGVATVYRALAAMAETGFVEVIGRRKGAAVYTHCRQVGHHHHVVCTSCGAVAETECELDEALRRFESSSGYRVTAHDLALGGICPACSSKEA